MSNSNSVHTSKTLDDPSSTPGPDVAAQKDGSPDQASKDEGRVDISTADDVNVDEDNAVGSPKNSLTATDANNTECEAGCAYAVAIIRETRFNDDVVKYLQGIDETLAPFCGKYVVHGGPYHPLEGSWKGDLVIIQFPSMEDAQAWYDSDAYASLRHLRTENTEGDVLLVQGVVKGHKGADLLK